MPCPANDLGKITRFVASFSSKGIPACAPKQNAAQSQLLVYFVLAFFTSRVATPLSWAFASINTLVATRDRRQEQIGQVYRRQAGELLSRSVTFNIRTPLSS
jgi:hypothetical protein